ncbi:MAG: hypothetical protein CMQ39_04230 [Gammaproteobacteria bacterium]|nr:hypothetical protein [Gammaproteobacteria bacterium]
MNVAKHFPALNKNCSELQCSQILQKNKRFKKNCWLNISSFYTFSLDINWIKVSNDVLRGTLCALNLPTFKVNSQLLPLLPRT